MPVWITRRTYLEVLKIRKKLIIQTGLRPNKLTLHKVIESLVLKGVDYENSKDYGFPPSKKDIEEKRREYDFSQHDEPFTCY